MLDIGRGVYNDNMKYYLAVDIGASSGRHIVGYRGADGKIQLDEVYRFPNGMKQSDDGLVWDVEALFAEVKNGLRAAIAGYGEICSMAIDTWGVDYVLMRGKQSVLPCFAYRNERTADDIDEVHKLVPFAELYRRTGIQFQTFNTVYQLYDDKVHGRLAGVTDFLMMPQYLAYRLTGEMLHEYTDATTGGLVNAATGQYDEELIAALGLPKQIFKPLSKPGTVVGQLTDNVAAEVGGQTTVVLCASHDTASAYEAVDCDENSVVLSSGTWSLIGAKLPQANTSEASLAANFSNEGGVGYFRYLKNIMGMWLINEVRRKKNVAITDIVAAAESSRYTQTFDVNDESLMAPSDMETAIRRLLADNPPQNDGDLYASIYRSLALSYGNAVCEMEKILGKTFDKIYIVGGGAKNKFLNVLTEQYTGKQVVALPIEATALGNILLQMRRD